MLRRIGIGFAFALLGYAIGAFGGGFLIAQFGAPKNDLSVEAAMTGAFFTGPLVAVVAFVVGFWWAGPAPGERS